MLQLKTAAPTRAEITPLWTARVRIGPCIYDGANDDVNPSSLGCSLAVTFYDLLAGMLAARVPMEGVA